MKTIEYGKENSTIIMLLHGGGLSWWNYRDEAEVLKENYHIILPVLDGHADSDKPFTSIENNAKEIIEYLDNNYHGKVLAIAGLSLGAQILVEILSQRKDICKYAIIESALVLPMKTTAALIGPSFEMSYGLIKQEWFSKLQFKSLKIQDKLYDDYYRDTCKISKQNMISFLKANSSYTLKSSLKNTTAKVTILVGSKETKIMLHSADVLHDTIPNSNLQILSQYYHGEFSLNHPKEYVDLLTHLLSAQ